MSLRESRAMPARPFDGEVGARDAVRITTGAPLPRGADAVLMAEHAEERDGRVLVAQPVSPNLAMPARSNPSLRRNNPAAGSGQFAVD